MVRRVSGEPEPESEGLHQGCFAVVRHWKGPNGGARQGSQDVVMEDGSFHIAATSLNLEEDDRKPDED